MLSDSQRNEIAESLRNGTLTVQSVSPDGQVRWSPVSAVLKHHTPHKVIYCVKTQNGSEVSCTEDHSLFLYTAGGPREVATSQIQHGDPLCVVRPDGVVAAELVASITEVESCPYTYDLSVPGDQNFVLSNGILAHNSYSIGGISLDLERSSKYDSLKSAAKDFFIEATQAKVDTVFHIRGLQQPRFGAGLSKLGPMVSRGVTNNPRAYVGVRG